MKEEEGDDEYSLKEFLFTNRFYPVTQKIYEYLNLADISRLLSTCRKGLELLEANEDIKFLREQYKEISFREYDLGGDDKFKGKIQVPFPVSVLLTVCKQGRLKVLEYIFPKCQGHIPLEIPLSFGLLYGKLSIAKYIFDRAENKQIDLLQVYYGGNKECIEWALSIQPLDSNNMSRALTGAIASENEMLVFDLMTKARLSIEDEESILDNAIGVMGRVDLFEVYGIHVDSIAMDRIYTIITLSIVCSHLEMVVFLIDLLDDGYLPYCLEHAFSCHSREMIRYIWNKIQIKGIPIPLDRWKASLKNVLNNSNHKIFQLFCQKVTESHVDLPIEFILEQVNKCDRQYLIDWINKYY